MADFVKTESGLLYQDDFSKNSLLWQMSPADSSYIENTDVGLKVNRNADYFTYTIREPSERRYSCYCEIDHAPYDYNDIVGFLIMANAQEYAECQLCKMDIPSGIQNSTAMKDFIISLMDAAIDKRQFIPYSLDDENPIINTDMPLEIENKTEWTKYYLNVMNQLLTKKYVTWNYEDYNDDGDIATTSGTWEETVAAAKKNITDFVDTNYRYIKIDKIGGLYSFYASEDGDKWIEVGNTTFVDAGRIGFFSYGTKDEQAIANNHFYVKNFALYKNRYLTLDGIKEGQKFKVLNGNTVLAEDSSSHVSATGDGTYLIDTHTFPVPFDGKIVLYQDDAVICEKTLQDIYGGDMISFSYNIKVSINNKEINPQETFMLGTFLENNQTFQLDIHNLESFALKDTKISVQAYSEYFSGAEPISISLYDADNKATDFKKEVTIDSINASEGKSILIGLDTKSFQNFYNNAEAFRFKLTIG